MSFVETELKGLMIASLGGDERAYRELLGRMSRLLRGYYKTRLTRSVRGPADAEDLVQETLIALHARRDTYDPAQRFTPWLHDYGLHTPKSVWNWQALDGRECQLHFHKSRKSD